MLFDARRALPQERQDILNAADYIREHGWCQGTMMSLGGQVCIFGALTAVLGGRMLSARAFLDKALGMPAHWWNDAPGRTKEEVIAKLEEIGWGE